MPPKKSLDTEGVVIAIGTVLEILSPGRRTGWAVADVEIVRRKALQKVDGGSSLSQRIVVDGIRPNKMKLQIEEVLNQMRQYRDARVDALAVEIPDAKVRRPEGRYFLG